MFNYFYIVTFLFFSISSFAMDHYSEPEQLLLKIVNNDDQQFPEQDIKQLARYIKIHRSFSIQKLIEEKKVTVRTVSSLDKIEKIISKEGGNYTLTIDVNGKNEIYDLWILYEIKPWLCGLIGGQHILYTVDKFNHDDKTLISQPVEIYKD